MALQFSYKPPAIDPGLLVHGLVEVAEDAGAQHLLKAAQDLVPVDSGDLKGSGIVVPSAHGAVVQFSAVNDEDDYDYASRIHEDENLHHPNGGQAHYLSDPMRTERTEILIAMAAKVKL